MNSTNMMTMNTNDAMEMTILFDVFLILRCLTVACPGGFNVGGGGGGGGKYFGALEINENMTFLLQIWY